MEICITYCGWGILNHISLHQRYQLSNSHHKIKALTILLSAFLGNEMRSDPKMQAERTLLQNYQRQQARSISTKSNDVRLLLAALKACSRTGNLKEGKQIHGEVVGFGHDRNIYVANALIFMYAKCGSMVDAHQVFDDMRKPTVMSWNVLILGYVENGQGHTALDLFEEMRFDGCSLNFLTFVAALKACTSVVVKGASGWVKCRDRGKVIHTIALKCGYSSDIYVQSSLISMYAKCGSMLDAREVFDGMKHQTVVPWTALILGYVDNGQCHTALDMFTRMGTEGPEPDSVTLMAALKACTSLVEKGRASLQVECKNRGKLLHNIIMENGCNSVVQVQCTLTDMYVKCGSMMDAREIFDYAKHRSVVSWNIIILGYADNGDGRTSLDMFSRMRCEGPAPNSATFVAALKACISVALTEGAKQWAECRGWGTDLHLMAMQNYCNSDVYVQSTLVDMYAKCGSMVRAREVFDDIDHPTIVSWNVLLLGYAYNGQGYTALDMFTMMRIKGSVPDSTTFVAALKACTSLTVNGASTECRDKGKGIHNYAVENGGSSDIYVQSSLVDMYVKCGSMVDAQEVFDVMKLKDVVSWTALILGYADIGQGHTALELFTKMRAEGAPANSVTFIAAIKACTSIAVEGGTSRWAECKQRGKEIHNCAVENGCNSDVYVQNCLADMFSKCGSMMNAREVFEGMKHPDVVSWNVLILGYADSGLGRPAVDLFSLLRIKGPAPNSVTFVAALRACGLAGALEYGRTIHSEIDNRNDMDVVLLTCLVDFYVKCGSLVEAQSVFDKHTDIRDMIVWNALLAGFSSSGDNEAVFRLFERMQDSGFKPDGVTFLSILTCCSHAGLSEKGKQCFDSMFIKHGIAPSIEHYNCMVDIFGRSNKFDDVMTLLKHMPCSPSVVTWRTILGACRKWRNVEIGKLAFHSLIDLDDRDAAAHLLMEQIYGSKGMLQEQGMVMELRKKLKNNDKLGEACWSNEAGEIHTFEDNKPVQVYEIREKWESLAVMMQRHGYTTKLLDKEEMLCGHSESQAVVCALLNTKPGETIRIVKNVRVCDDSHAVISVISKLEVRTIICRDPSRIHVFKGGTCSCRDYW